MTSPVQLSDLDLAATADNADLALIRKSNTTDYKVTVQALRNIDLTALPVLPANASNLDLMMISQSGTNCQIHFGQVGFVAGTQMWFYSGVPPSSFWTIVPGTGDKVLAVANGTGLYAIGGTTGGTPNWQQTGVSLTAAQLPPHTHTTPSAKSDTSSNYGFVAAGKDENTFGITSGTGDGLTGSPHNHGNSWRPLANVGIICQKQF